MTSGVNWSEFETPQQNQMSASGVNWGEFETAEPVQEVQQPKEVDRIEKLNQYGQEAAGGLVRASAGLEWLGGAALETVYDAGRIIGREGYKAVTGDYPGGEIGRAHV